jgi:CBS domain-containing protein
MKVKDIMNKNIISVGHEETVSTALNKMKAGGVHQLVVMDKKTFSGMLELKSLITKEMDPTTTKISGFVKKVPSIDPEDDAMKSVELLLGSGVRALPVISKGQLVGVVSETDIVKVENLDIDKSLTLKQIMTPCVYVDKDEKASKIKNLMFETNVSRIPVLDGDNVIGIVGTLNLIKVLEAKSATGQRMGHTGEKMTMEKLRTSDISAESIMSKPIVLPGEKKLADALPLLEKYEELVVKNGEVGIITPKDVLELLVKTKKKGVYVQITGMQDESSEFQAVMDKTVQDFVQKYGKMSDKMEYLAIHVERMQKQGPQQKYSVRVRMKVPFGLFVAHAWGWQSMTVVQEAFSKMEKEFMRKYEQIKGHDKFKKSKARVKKRS